MSSRLNPRDYDLGELREAVREASRHHDGPRGGRREDGRRDAHRDHRRGGDFRNGAGPAEPVRSSDRDSTVEEQPFPDGSPSENGTSNGASPDNAPSSPAGTGEADEDAPTEQAAEGQYRERHRPRSHSVPEPSPDRRANRPGGRSRTADRRPAVGRMRRNRRRFARSSSRDRTADGSPRRRDETGSENDSGWRPGSQTSHSERDRRFDKSGSEAPDHCPPGTRAGGFELLSAASSENAARPYLDRLPQGYRAQVEIFAWLEELLATCGRDSTVEALAYYEAVGWLSEESRESLEDFVDGLTAAEPPDPRPLGVDDHRASLRYVARLARRVDQ